MDTHGSTMDKLRTLIVDDSAVYRKILSDILSIFSNIDVVGVAQNGRIAIKLASTLKLDFITLDIEMPEMDGIATLKELKRMGSEADVVMVSTYSTEGAAITMRALEMGACDFVAKPSAQNMAEGKEALSAQLRAVVAAISTKRRLRCGSADAPRQSVHSEPPPVSTDRRRTESAGTKADEVIRRMRTLVSDVRRDIVAIGISTGGPNALNSVIPPTAILP